MYEKNKLVFIVLLNTVFFPFLTGEKPSPSDSWTSHNSNSTDDFPFNSENVALNIELDTVKLLQAGLKRWKIVKILYYVRITWLDKKIIA